MTHCKSAYLYALAVVNEKISACQWVKFACLRQLNELEKFPRGFIFDVESAEKVCNTLETFHHVKGEWAKRKEKIKLEPWQQFILTTVFGWKVRKTGFRRFKTVYIEVPRKNAKSTLSAGVGLYMLAEDEEEGAEVYSAATTRDQAKIVFSTARQMAIKSPSWCQENGVKYNALSVHKLENASYFHALSAEHSSLDGLNVHCSVIDELHAHKRREVFDVIESSTGSRSQPLVWIITTAGSNRSGICYEQRTYLTKVLEGVFKDQSYFGIIYMIFPRFHGHIVKHSFSIHTASGSDYQ